MSRWVALSCLLLVGCPSESAPAGTAMPTAFGGTVAMPGTVLPSATPAPGTASPSGQDCHVYPRRCEASCKGAFLSSVSLPGNHVDPATFGADAMSRLGPCLAGCDLDHDAPQGCVGASSEAECSCQVACFASTGLTSEQIAMARQVGVNLDAAIGPSCR